MSKKHGDSYTRLYKIYKNMKRRCYTTLDEHQINNYRNRNITICDEWLKDYISFKTWAMNNGYNDNLSIDRVDNNKGYSPDNCRWTTAKEQSNNKRTNVYITIDGVTRTMAQWCEINNVSRNAACKRIEKYGWNPVVAVTKPVMKKEKYGKYSRKRIADEREIVGVLWKELEIEYNGEVHNAEEWSHITGISSPTIRWRIKNGWTTKDVLTKPVKKNLIGQKYE